MASALHLVPVRSRIAKLNTLPVWRILRGGEFEGESSSSQNVVEEGEDISVVDDTKNNNMPRVVLASSLPLISGIKVALIAMGKTYSQQLDQRPILTKSLTAGFVFGLSDFLAQRIEQGGAVDEKGLELSRLVSSTLVGLLYFGPAAHYWYETIFRLLPGTGLLSTLYKAFWGQVLFGPSFTCIFFGTSLIQAGTFTPPNWWKKIRRDLPGAWLAGLGFWPLVDLLSYSVVPIQWIPLFVNLCSLVWTVYLSLVANRNK